MCTIDKLINSYRARGNTIMKIVVYTIKKVYMKIYVSDTSIIKVMNIFVNIIIFMMILHCGSLCLGAPYISPFLPMLW